MKKVGLNRLLSVLKVGETLIAQALDAKSLSSEFARLRPLKYTQNQVFVVNVDNMSISKAFLVERKE